MAAGLCSFSLRRILACSLLLNLMIMFCCAAVPCDNPPELPHVEWKLDESSIPAPSGSFLRFQCDLGYVGDGAMRIFCVNGSWNLPEELCQPKSCGYPGDIENADREGMLYSFPNSVTYSCKEGYRMKGLPRIFCTTNGSWKPALPSCEAVVCPLLSDPEDGKVISVDRSYNSIAKYECNRKFRLKGDSQRICQADAIWSGSSPHCIAVICAHPGPLLNGRVLPPKDEYRADDVIIFKCNVGKIVTSKCTEEGTWTIRPPICEGPTEVTIKIKTEVPSIQPTMTDSTMEQKHNHCDYPGDIHNGKLEHVQSFILSSNVTYICDDGYELRGEGTLVCLPSGKWNLEKLPICVKPIPVGTIVGIVVGITLVIICGISCFMFYRWREKKLRGYGLKSKALTADAADMEEIAGLEKGKKPIPVTVL